MRDISKWRVIWLKVFLWGGEYPTGTSPQTPRTPRSEHAEAVGPQGALASLTSGWARALVSSAAHARERKEGLLATTPRPFPLLVPPTGTGLSPSLALLLRTGLSSGRGLFGGLRLGLTWSSLGFGWPEVE